MNEFDVIIVGAGICGLTAARELSRKKLNVGLLEARDRIGGRIHTIHSSGFEKPVETGAEFVHGNLPHTLAMLKEYNIGYTAVTGEMWRTRGGQLTIDSGYLPGFEEVNQYLAQLTTDMSVDKFLEKYFADAKYEPLKTAIRKFVEGFDTADSAKASIYKFKEEWGAFEEEEDQYRVDGGYEKLTDALAKEIESNGGTIHLLSPVQEIMWNEGFAHVHTGEVEPYLAPKVIITVPLGILTAPADHNSAIQFVPPVHNHIQAAKKLGYGHVVKILLQFNEAFWTGKTFENYPTPPLKNMGFIFSDTDIPTWWTQLPDKGGLLTGWVGGPEAKKMMEMDNEPIFRLALQSLVNVFGSDEKALLAKLKAWKVINWSADPYTLGSYSYATPGSDKYIDTLLQPVENTLYFAGEALHKGKDSGTVEAAIASGLAVSRLVG